MFECLKRNALPTCTLIRWLRLNVLTTLTMFDVYPIAEIVDSEVRSRLLLIDIHDGEVK